MIGWFSTNTRHRRCFAGSLLVAHSIRRLCYRILVGAEILAAAICKDLRSRGQEDHHDIWIAVTAAERRSWGDVMRA